MQNDMPSRLAVIAEPFSLRGLVVITVRQTPFQDVIMGSACVPACVCVHVCVSVRVRHVGV